MRTSAKPRVAALLALLLAAGCAARPGTANSSPQLARSAPPAHASAADSPESIGSTRNGRVAFAMRSPGSVPLTFLAGDLPDEERARFARLAPNVKILSGLTRESALEHAAEANGAEAQLLSPAFLERSTKLVWVQAMSAGVESYLSTKGLAESDRIVFTNMRAVHGPSIADHAFAMLLTMTRNLRYYEASQAAGRWTREEPASRSIALHGRTLLVVGIGGIGSEIAERAHAFGMRVIATRRTDTPAPSYVERVGKPQDLLGMLPEADVVAICVPLTPETERMFSAAAFAAMKPGAYLINISRGKVVDTEALVAALQGGHLAGAGLDVTDPEPLPPGHPLWRLPNVVITPHVASDAELTDERRLALYRENMRRFGAGEPLLNVVDKHAGY